MKEIIGEVLTEERALFKSSNLMIRDTIFEVGESPLKESHDYEVHNCMFKWFYPLWYGKNVLAKDCKFFVGARAAVWYTDDVVVENAMVEAPKTFRRCHNLTMKNVDFYNAEETLWHCDGVKLENVSARGDYFAMNTDNLYIDNLRLDGKYSFDGCKNLEIHNSNLISKDSFWNSENVTVYDSYIAAEYLGWNAKNLTFINCTIESEQGLCYVDNLVMKNCKFINTTLAFEYSSVDVEITGKIDSIMNPTSGTITVDKIGTLIIQDDKVDASKTKIICSDIEARADEPIWK